ncbi:DMT family transporter [Fluviicola sp.]|jgi:drug/metabolite transporter (DMT)-like permease|uniref:DMT family transporter n=1 Tax=Fluviicola sp. TaxID=1917219 RepID=UPI00281C6904|nr:DMT family transporter [Fluviicola sp.]MDR0802366.1 DMT family transporter [Fluviicola sp.]
MNEKQTSQSALTIMMIISMIIWGISWPSNKVLTSFGTPVVLGFFRYGFVVVSLILLLIPLKTNIVISKKGIPFLLASGSLMAAYNYTFLGGLQNGSPGAGGILVTTLNPVMAYGIGMLVDWKRPTRNESIGLLFGIIAGLTLLKVWGNEDIFAKPGNLLFLLSALIWSVMSKFTSKSAKYGSPLAFTWWMYFVTLMCIVPFCDFKAIGTLIQITDLKFWGNAFFSSVITTTLATTTYFYATSKIGAEKASSFIFIVPFSAAVFSFAILGESLEIHTITGGSLGIAAVYMINKK